MQIQQFSAFVRPYKNYSMRSGIFATILKLNKK